MDLGIAFRHWHPVARAGGLSYPLAGTAVATESGNSSTGDGTCAKRAVMLRYLPTVLCALFALALGTQSGVAQEQEPTKPVEKPAETKPDDGHDRPTPYPRIRFKRDKIEKVETPDGSQKDVTSRAYLLDLSDDMIATETTAEGAVTTRLEIAKSKLKQALDELSRRRDTVFNIASFGNVADLAENKQPVAVSAEVIERAKKWVDDREASGKSDIYSLLKAVFEQEPTAAQLLVGSDPVNPTGVELKDIEAAGGLQEYMVAAVREWRKNKKTRLDIVGISLSENQREFYRKLASAGGGTYLDG